MAWGNTDGPEMGPEWHGEERGTDSRLGCFLAMVSTVLVVLIIAYVAAG